MAGTGLKLVNKLARRARYIKERQRDKYDRVNKLEIEMRKSPRSFELARKAQRRADRNWGLDTVAQKPVLGYEATATTVARIGTNIVLTVPTAILAAMDAQPGDVIRLESGPFKSYELLVVSTSSTQLTLTDIPSFGAPESNITFLALLSSEKKSFI